MREISCQRRRPKIRKIWIRFYSTAATFCARHLVPSKFISHDMEIDYEKDMSRIQGEMKDVIADERESQRMLLEAFKGIVHGIE